MALGTFTARVGERSGSIYATTFDQVGDDAYPTNGTASFSAHVSRYLNKGSATLVACSGLSTNGTYEAIWIASTDKLKVFVTATGVEVAADVSLAGSTFQLTALYK
jgi:hypothetical protein